MMDYSFMDEDRARVLGALANLFDPADAGDCPHQWPLRATANTLRLDRDEDAEYLLSMLASTAGNLAELFGIDRGAAALALALKLGERMGYERSMKDLVG